MTAPLSKTLLLYGIFLIFAGAAGFLSNPEKAKTALISGGTFGGLCIFWGLLSLKQVKWSLKAGFFTVIFLSLTFAWRAFVTWKNYFAGNPEKLFAACLISAMLSASLLVLSIFLKNKK